MSINVSSNTARTPSAPSAPVQTPQAQATPLTEPLSQPSLSLVPSDPSSGTPSEHQGKRLPRSQLRQVSLNQASPQDVTGVSPGGNGIPSLEQARQADGRLQKNLTHWLTTGKLRAQPIPENASIEPFVGAYRTAVGDPQVQAWFKSKHLNLSTVRVYSDRVEGVVVRDGQEVQAQFSTTDGSGWWEVSAKVRATQKMLSPSDIGILLPDASTGSFNHVDTILDFYGVVIPNDPTASKVLGEQLKTSGWPVISDDKRIQWAQQLAQCSQRNTDREGRSGLAVQLKTLLNGKREGDDLKLSEQTAVVSPESTLAQKSQVPRQRFLEFLASPPFKAFIEKTGFGGANQGFRISEGTLQLRDSANQWISLKRFFDDEVSKVSAGGNAQERAAVDRLNADLNQLVDMSNHTGKALYSTFTYDVRQVLEFNCLGSPVTVAQTRDAVDWLNRQLPPPPTAGDYAGLSPYTWTAGALSPGNYPVLKAMSNGPGSVSERLARYAVVAQAKAGGAAEPDLTLHTFFDSPDALAKAEQMARALELAEVADGRPLSRAMRHQLLSTALKLSVDPDLPGKPGLVAGYDIYQPNNLGRTLDEVRSDIEKHLERKGVSASSAPLVAHLFLAQAAPEFLIRPDPTVSLQAPKELRLSPGQVTVGSTAWLDMRLGCAMAEKLAGAGSSRAMNYTQILNLTRLNATTLEQEELIKDLGAKPLLDWAIMAGIFPKTRDGRYSPGDYEAASKAFAAREEATRQAFATLTAEPPTRTSVLIKQLAVLFPELTEEEIRNFRLEEDLGKAYASANRGHMETRSPLLTEVLLAKQVELDPLFKFQKWLNELSGEKKYRFNHPTVSQATFEARIKNLPPIAAAVESAVDTYIADTRSAQKTVIELMVANAPLNIRQALQVGKVELFTLREETGEALEDDQGPSSKVEEKKGRHGVLLRYETEAAKPRFSYLEVFPGSMKMIPRFDFGYSLSLDGKTEDGKKPFGPFANVIRSFRKGKPESVDFQAYATGAAPRPNIKSNVIIEKAGVTLQGEGLSQWPGPAPVYVPNSFSSTKTGQIAEAILNSTFDGRREQLLEYANEPTKMEQRSSFPFDSGKVFTIDNLRTVLSLTPFVGSVVNIADGNIGEGLKGLLIDFTSFAATGGLVTAKAFYKGIKAVVPLGNRAFSMTALKGSGPFLRSLFNPLDGTLNVLKSGASALRFSKSMLSGNWVSVGEGLFMAATAFEKCRWGMGVYDQLAANAATQAANRYPGSRAGTSQNSPVYAVQKGSKWYAIDPATRQPAGAPLEDFKADSALE